VGRPEDEIGLPLMRCIGAPGENFSDGRGPNNAVGRADIRPTGLLWIPAINLKDGTVLSAGGTNYVVKAVEEGLVMNTVVGLDPAPELVIDTTVAPPSPTYDASKTALVGAVPTGVELRIIKGELVD